MTEMRYYKYKNTGKIQNVALKEQYKLMTEGERRTARKEKAWRRFGTVVSVTLFCLIFFLGTALISIIPMPSWWLWEVLAWAGKGIIVFFWLIASIALAAMILSPLWKKIESFNVPSMRKEIFSKACAHLREYYGIEEPYLITKCFDSTEKKFKNHDVCIFVAYDELRITTDLNRGFLHGDRDLGCYAFCRDEIVLTKQEHDGHSALDLRSGDTVFLLGYRAKGFIEKNFILKESE